MECDTELDILLREIDKAEGERQMSEKKFYESEDIVRAKHLKVEDTCDEYRYKYSLQC